MEKGKLKKRLSKLVACIVSAAIVFSLVPKILGTDIVRADGEYNIWVGDVQVNDTNKGNVLNTEGEPSVTFNSDTYTLTFNNPVGLGTKTVDSSEVVVYIGDLGRDISICGKAELVSDLYTYAFVSSPNVKVTFNGEFSSDKSFVVKNMVVDGGKITTGLAIDAACFTMNGGTVVTPYFTGESCTIAGGSFTANNENMLVNGSAGIQCKNLKITGGTVNSTGPAIGIYSADTVDISGGVVEATGFNFGIYAENDITVSGQTAIVVADATSEADSFAIGSKSGDITLSDKMGYLEFEDACAGPFNGGSPAYSYNNVVYNKPKDDGGFRQSNITIANTDKIGKITYNPGEGTGEYITELHSLDEEYQLREFPKDLWQEPSSGKHFYRWSVVDGNVTGELEFPLTDYTICGRTATMTATYYYWITGWEDTGDNGVDTSENKGVNDVPYTIAQTGAEIPMVSGDGIDISLKKGYILVDNRLDFVSCSSGTVIKTITMTEGSSNYYYCDYDYKDFNEDVYLRFTTQFDPSTISCTVTWKAGEGTGTDITETAGYGEKVYFKDFPSTWTEPADGRHFDGWQVEGTNITPHYEWCSGGWTPGIVYESVYEDITCTAKYKYWITGYEDTGDGGIKEIGDTLRGIVETGSDNCASEGDTVELEITYKDGFSMVDDKVEVIGVSSGNVIATVTLSYHEMSHSYRGTFTMPGEDVTLRFATKDNNASSSSSSSSSGSSSSSSSSTDTSSSDASVSSSDTSSASGSSATTVTNGNPYVIVKGANGTWDGVSNYIVEVSDSVADDTILDRYLWSAVDGHQLGDGEHVIRKGSVIVEIYSDYLKTLSAGEHTIVVNFSDYSVTTTITISAAASGGANAASVPSTGETIAPSLFAGSVFVIAALGVGSAVIVKKRKEEI